MTASVEFPATVPAMPVMTVEEGTPHIWLPDLDANEYTVAKLSHAFTTLAITHPDAILDDLESDASGGYLAFRVSGLDRPGL